MRLLAQSENMTSAEHFKAESFAEWLLAVGEGRDNTTPRTELPFSILSNYTLTDISDLCMPVGKETVEDLIHEIYSDLDHITSSTSETTVCEYFSKRVILAARNIDV